MTLKEALKWGVSRLRKDGVDSPELDAELLLTHCTIRANGTVNRAWLFAHGEDQARRGTIEKYKKLIALRARREPVAYILGHKEFYGLEFAVNREVLIPRPETETLVEEAIRGIMDQEARGRDTVIVDVGTGSGAIAVAVAKECKIKNVKCKIFGTDISPAALRIARKNARRHGVERQIKFLRGNLLEPIFNYATCYMLHATRLIITANLPYLPTSEWRTTAPEIKKWEPRGALDGGRDGLKYYDEIFAQLSVFFRKYPCPFVSCFCEICPHQVTPFKKMVREYFKRARFKAIKDLSGRARVVKFRI